MLDWFHWRKFLFQTVLKHVYVVQKAVFSLVSSKQEDMNDIRTQRYVLDMGEVGGGRTAAAVLHVSKGTLW